ncbi:MAG: WG repeat-containing protein [Mariniphaga sp.]
MSPSTLATSALSLSEFENMGEYKNGGIPVQSNGKWGLVDRKGKVFFPFLADWAISFTDGFAPYEIGGKYGFMYTKVSLVGRTFYIDRGGREIL